MTVSELRHTYPAFYYRSYAHQLTPQGLEISFEFAVPPDITFRPRLIISGVTQENLDKIALDRLNNYVFHLGLVEMLSYWKATCSPEIIVEAGSLNPDQLAWWHHLLIKGMGEYFYVNQIDFTQPDFVRLRNGNDSMSDSTAVPPQLLSQTPTIPPQVSSVLIPIGGGKDSAVTLELLNPANPEQLSRRACLIINPTPAASQLAKLSGTDHQILVDRQLDPKLFDLNAQGYLNGHTPFSALAAWISVLAAELFQLESVAVSNEHSSNEGNVVFHGVEINHQYSKSYEFEKSFQVYCQTFFPGAPHYFSFLRPLFELQIARLFAEVTQSPDRQSIRTTFRSCNRGQKTNSWCGECSKCLFAYLILSPFLSQAELTTMFGKNLLADESLWPTALDLLGKGENKPLECVGTYQESLLAFYLTTQRLQAENQALPALLARVEQEILRPLPDLSIQAEQLLTSWNNHHSIPNQLAEILKQRLVPST